MSASVETILNHPGRQLIQNLKTVRKIIWRLAAVVEKGLPASAIDLPKNGELRLPMGVARFG